MVLFLVVLTVLLAGGFALSALLDPRAQEPTAEISTRVVRIGGSTDGDLTTYYVDFYIDRTDLGLIEPPNESGELYDTLPLSQQLDYLSAQAPTKEIYGLDCDAGFFPHRCEVSEPGTYTLEARFKDGAYAVTTLEVPAEDYPALPEIEEPTQLPEQGERLHMRFRDTGATSYTVWVDLCGFYNNDGINPCLEGQDFVLLESSSGEWLVENEYGATEVQPLDESLDVTGDMLLEFEDSIRYRVCGYYQTVREDGIETYFTACDLKEFVR